LLAFVGGADTMSARALQSMGCLLSTQYAGQWPVLPETIP